MAQNPIDIGITPNDGTGDTNRDAFNKTNLNDADLQSQINVNANKSKSATSSLLTAGSNQTITYASAFTDANYNLIISAVDSNGISSSIIFISKDATGFTFDLPFDSIVTYIAHKN